MDGWMDWSLARCQALNTFNFFFSHSQTFSKRQISSHLSQTTAGTQEQTRPLAHFVNTRAQNVHVLLWMTRVCVCVCAWVPPPSYCLPILSKRQKPHLDLVGWRVRLLHRALLVNWRGCFQFLTPPPLRLPSLPGSPYVLPASKCPAQQIFETSQVNHKTENLLPPPLQTETEREWPKETRTHRVAAFRTGKADTRAASC